MPVTTEQAEYADVDELALHLVRASMLPAAVTDEMKVATIQSASGTVDSYLAGRFKLPLTEWGIDIVEATCAIAAYRLVRKYGSNVNSTDGANFRQAYDDAIAWLKHVSDGKATPAGVTVTDSSTEAPTANAPFVLAPAAGSIGSGTGAFAQSEDDDDVEIGTVGPPRLRGW